jgi:glycogen operon protein
MASTLLPGRPYPLGAKWDGTGVNFAIYSENATAVELCLFNADGKQTEQILLRETTAFIWHGYIPGLQAGQLYGYRVHGPWDPQNGFRFNPAKLVTDPNRSMAINSAETTPTFTATTGTARRACLSASL